MHSSCSLAHLDVKLENVVLDGWFRPKLIDFAFADVIGRPLNEFRGTELYMAPEVCAARDQGTGFQGQHADMFSLGVLLFTMFFGQPPFKVNYLPSVPLACRPLWKAMVSGTPEGMYSFL